MGGRYERRGIYLLVVRLVGRRKISGFGAMIRILTMPFSSWVTLGTFLLMSFGLKISETRLFLKIR